jgi:hypothetical protein
MNVNLLPEAFIRRLLLRRQVSRWGFAVGLSIVVCGGVIAAQYRAIIEARQAQSASAFRSQDLHALKTETQRLSAEATTTESAIAALAKARPEDRTLALMGITSTSAKKLDGKVHLKNVTTQIASALAATPNSLPGGAPAKKPVSGPVVGQTLSDLSLEGNADDAASISRFIEALRDTGVFIRVDLTATNEASGGNGAARQFRVDCKF